MKAALVNSGSGSKGAFAGGVAARNVAPIQKAIDLGCCDIDAIVLENQEKKYNHPPSKNGFE